MPIKTSYLLPVFLLLSAASTPFFFGKNNDWDADAGLIPSYTEGAKVTASSNTTEASKVLDGGFETAWLSGAPLPTGFVSNASQNVLLGKTASPATDGDLNTATEIAAKQGGRGVEFSLHLMAPQLIFLKLQASAPVRLFAEGKNGSQHIGEYLPEENFTFKKISVDGGPFSTLHLRSEKPFQLFEIAALAGMPTESITIDFGKIQPVGTVLTRHWAGEATALRTRLLLSLDGKSWQQVAELDPTAQHPVLTAVEPEVPARYLKLEHELADQDWAKVFVWEVKAYDRHGPFGKRQAAMPSVVSLREMLGVNGYWSWGTETCSADLPAGDGPQRYAQVASHGRNYHDLTWDINSPGQPIDFSKMEKEGTPAKPWLRWDREYRAWLDAGLDVQASLQFYRFKPEAWKNPEPEAFAYAKAFTRHFGASKGNGLVCTIEAGNEPWEYPAAIYQKILLGMAKGAEAGDPTVEVFPCALQAADPAAEQTDVFKNYIGARVGPEAAALLDGINVHAYSYVTQGNGKRRAVHPEHPHSTFWEILNAIRWRNANMPGKKIYLSEWGWDCGGGGEDCTHAECVSEQAAASYAVRAALIANRLGIERASWFFYANVEQASSLYTRSGLTSSRAAGFEKKKPYQALAALVTLAGNGQFYSVVGEDEQAWMYLLADKFGKPTHLIAWRPVSGDDHAEREVHWKSNLKIKTATILDGQNARGTPMGIPIRSGNGYQLVISAVPVLYQLSP